MESLSPVKNGRLMGHISQVSNAQNVNLKYLGFTDHCSWHFIVPYAFCYCFPSSFMTSKPTSHVTTACSMPEVVIWAGLAFRYLCLPSQWCCSTGISACQTGWGGFTDCTSWCSSVCTAWGQPGTPPPHPLLCVLSLGAVGHLATWNPTSWCNPGCSHVLLLFSPSFTSPGTMKPHLILLFSSELVKHVVKHPAYQKKKKKKCILCYCFLKTSPDFECPISSFLLSWCC